MQTIENQTTHRNDADSKPGDEEAHLITVRPTVETMTRQLLPNFVGISEATAGAKGLSMNLVVIPPGGSAAAHLHKGFESGIYLLKGRVETLYGPGLQHSVINEPGDFIFIPADLPHQPFNMSDTETVHAIVVRNDPNEQESVVLYDPAEHAALQAATNQAVAGVGSTGNHEIAG